ncbi:hypothetical protein WJ54_33610 [Burkholderia ubonensis]|nr:hypothetical protein WJ54_33610 [Burkholderia ubonensis]
MLPNFAGATRWEGSAEVKRNLMTEEVEIDPSVGASTFGATEHISIEGSCLVEILDVVGHMEERLHDQSPE